MLNLDILNEAQLKAVTYGANPLMVLAGPGSGKTTVVIQRVFYLLEHLKASPENILVLTFTKDAALSMKNRFLQQSDKPYPVPFGTFHSCFYNIIKTYPSFQKTELLTDTRKRKILFGIARKVYEQIEEKETENLLAAISYFKNTNDFESSIQKLPVLLRERFDSVFQTYEAERHRQNLMDFDDMVYECSILLSRDLSFKQYWSSRFHHILLDEFQDINPRQYEVIRMIAEKTCPVFAVGDDDQSIYRFRGAAPECIKRFLEDYQAETVLLQKNYRSTEGIIQAASSVIAENKNRFPKNFLSDADNRINPSEVLIRAFCNKEDQNSYLLEQLKTSVEMGSCAVLFRTNLMMQRFGIFLQKNNLKYSMKEKTMNIYEHFIVKDIMAYLRLSRGEESNSLYLQIMNRPYRGIDREWVSRQNTRAVSKGQQILQSQLFFLGKCSLFLGVQYIRRAIGYEEYLQKLCGNNREQYQECLEVLDFVCEDAKEYRKLEEWMTAQKGYIANPKKTDSTQSMVQLMTVHGAKGLEFDKVWIPDCNEGIYPYGNMLDTASCEEERRILYVAMTRAKSSLEVTYLSGNEKHPRLPSRFLQPIL